MSVAGSTHFYPRPPRGGRQTEIARTLIVQNISIHALREEGDLSPHPADRARPKISIHALREEGDRVIGRTPGLSELFLSTPSARRATGAGIPAPAGVENFYPRPPRGGRRSRPAYPHTALLFLSTPSARRATLSTTLPSCQIMDFYPRPPRGGRQHLRRNRRGEGAFLSTPSARRATLSLTRYPKQVAISIHALREEGDPASLNLLVSQSVFLSTPSARRATQQRLLSGLTSGYFYPRPPRGGRPAQYAAGRKLAEISIHALREEGDHRILFIR